MAVINFFLKILKVIFGIRTPRVFVIGDIHGGYKSLIQCLVRCGFDYNLDTLIVLGDVVDGWPETPQVIQELLKIKNLILIMGNHDKWADDWFKMGAKPIIWTQQGGQATIDAYVKYVDKCVEKEVPLMVQHREFFNRAHYYYVDNENRLFVHGGIPQDTMFKGMSKINTLDLLWDRSLADLVLTKRIKGKKFQGKDFKEIYLGHTTTSRVSSEPIISENVILMDTGGGYEGKLSIMNIDTKEFWQSDSVKTLYPNHLGR